MTTETEWQRKIIQQMKNEGGYGYKNDSLVSTAIGRPDLFLSCPETGPFMAEVKLEREWNTNTGRTIKLTARQFEESRRLQAASCPIVVVVVVNPPKPFIFVADPAHVYDVPVARDELISNAWLWKSSTPTFRQYLLARAKLGIVESRYGTIKGTTRI